MTDDLHKMSILVLHNHASGFATMLLLMAVHCLTSVCWTNEDSWFMRANRLLEQCILGDLSLNAFTTLPNASAR